MGAESDQLRSSGKDEGEERVINVIRMRLWRFMGHLLRENNGMEHHIVETEIMGKRERR